MTQVQAGVVSSLGCQLGDGLAKAWVRILQGLGGEMADDLKKAYRTIMGDSFPSRMEISSFVEEDRRTRRSSMRR